MVPKKPDEALNADAITEILIRIPAKSVCRFRCVSKLWFSLISDPRFIRAHAAAAHAEPTGFYLYDRYTGQSEFYHLNGGGGGFPDPALSFLDYRGLPLEPVDSCDGLLLCRQFKPFVVSVCNPTSREHEVIPLPNAIYADITRASLHLAFDPRRSPHYMILAPVWACRSEDRRMYKYTSETRSWKLLEDWIVGCWPIARHPRNVVCWKGSLLSTDHLGMLVALDLESEQILEILLPPPRQPWDSEQYEFLHLGASGDRLHCMRGESSIRFVMWEMTSVHSGWHVLHIVDLDSVMRGESCIRSPYDLVEFIRGDEDGLLIQMQSRIVSFRIPHKSFTTICEVPLARCGHTIFLVAHSLFPLHKADLAAAVPQPLPDDDDGAFESVCSHLV